MDYSNIFGQASLTTMGILVLKIFMLFMAVVYFIYTIVLSRRIKIMNQNLKTTYERSFVRLSRLHVIASVVAIALFSLSLIF